ncbi:hypothetical protein DU484_07605 [Haloplanus rubicundus]|uniref:NrS-1 polymerase-like HBD domain-containing protein n=2 Tax=Haloplanus rubicundus TaxID=1547898 RepID=A0A345EC14_9EURY|nr:hypothetical protein DU484_07605 [Haloplanus rubicundus]
MSMNTVTDSKIPDTIRSFEQWICWREDERDGKPTKVPIKPYRTSGNPLASVTDSGTWRDFETALTYHRESAFRTDGVGFVFDPEAEIVGVDLDNCRDAESGDLEPWAVDIIDRLDSYTEVSPSGTGIHVLVKGELHPGRNRRGDVEMYDRDRFFTVTGSHVPETREDIARRQDALQAVHHDYVQTAGDMDEATTLPEMATNRPSQTEVDEAEVTRRSSSTRLSGPNSETHGPSAHDFSVVDDPALEAALHGLSLNDLPEPIPRTIDEAAGPGVNLSDTELLRRATASKSGRTIQALLDGDSSLWCGRDSRYPSQSEADMGLCFYLAFWTGGDPERIDRLFRESGLMREKWDRRHYANGATYGNVCIARTLLKLNDYYTPPGGGSGADTNASQWPAPKEPTGRTDISQSPLELPRNPSTDASGDSATRPSANRAAQPIDMTAVEDAQRLATTVKRQQAQLDAYEERIADLETHLRLYRIALNHQSSDASFSDDSPEVESATYDSQLPHPTSLTLTGSLVEGGACPCPRPRPRQGGR